MPGPHDSHDHADPPGLLGPRRHQPAAIRALNALNGLIEDAYAHHIIDDAGRNTAAPPFSSTIRWASSTWPRRTGS